MSRARLRSAVVSAALVVSAGTVVGLIDSSAGAAASSTIKVTHSKPIRHERFIVKGQLSTAVERPVQLQRKSGSHWKVVKAGTTDNVGAYAFSTSTTGPKVYRVKAPAVTIDTTAYATLTTSHRAVKPVSQKVKVTVSRKVVHEGQSLTLRVEASPVRKGRAFGAKITIDGHSVSGSEIGAQNSKGVYKTTDKLDGAPHGKYVFKIYAVSQDGAPRKYGNTVSFTAKK